MADYAHPEVLVTTQWVADHLTDAKVRVIEVDVDTTAYDQGHLAGAAGWNWQTQLQDSVRRDLIGRAEFEKLCGQAGVANDSTVVLYGDNHNWFAAWAFWQFKFYGHRDARLMNGGRKKWIEEKRPLTTDKPKVTPAPYQAREADRSIRALRSDVFELIGTTRANLVDVRSPDEYTGKVIAPPGMSETAQRGGHIPGAKNIPWSNAVNPDGTFKTVDELRALYQSAGVDPKKPSIAYCRIGERSSHTWFVLRYLLGYDKVKNYDGSWTEWGNLIEAPIER